MMRSGKHRYRASQHQPCVCTQAEIGGSTKMVAAGRLSCVTSLPITAGHRAFRANVYVAFVTMPLRIFELDSAMTIQIDSLISVY